MRRAGGGYRFQPLIAPDAVFHVNDDVALGDFGELLQEVARPAPAPRPARKAFSQDVLFGDDREVRAFEAVFQRQNDRGEPVGRQAVQLAGCLDRLRHHPLLAEQSGKPVPGAFAIGREQRLPARRRMGRQPVCDGAVEVDIGARPRFGEIDRRPGSGVGTVRRRRRQQQRRRTVLKACFPACSVEIKPVRRERPVWRLTRRRVSPCRIVVRNGLQADVPRRARLLVLDHGSVRQIVGKGFERATKERQPVFDSDSPPPCGYRFVERVVGRYGSEFGTVTFAKAGDALAGQHDLARRNEFEAFQPVGAALVYRVEPADFFDLVAEQVDPKRCGLAGREQVDQPAADSILARLHHRLGALIAMPLQKGEQRLRVHGAVGFTCKAASCDFGARRHALEKGVGGCQQNVGPRPVRQRRQGCKTLRHDVAARRIPVVGQAIPAREPQQFQARREKAEPVGHPRHLRVVARDMDDRPVALSH